MVRNQLNALTVDLEDWFHPEYICSRVDPTCAPSMIEEPTRYILRIFNEFKIKSTFFINGQIAEQFPHLIKEIHSVGHEVASHGYSHSPLWRLTPRDFQNEITRMHSIISRITGEQPIGFRAPSFSLTNSTVWALRMLQDNGYQYDSSVFPVKTTLYGVSSAPAHPYRPSLIDLRVECNETRLVEFPPLTSSILGVRIPTSGGFYFRILPTSIIKHSIYSANKKGFPAMLYFHPWEILNKTPRIPMSPFRYFVSYINLSRVEKQIRKLARSFTFTTVREILGL